jgi:hypothetical protein
MFGGVKMLGGVFVFLKSRSSQRGRKSGKGANERSCRPSSGILRSPSFSVLLCESGRDAYKYRPLFLQRITLQTEWECGLENASRQERT